MFWVDNRGKLKCEKNLWPEIQGFIDDERFYHYFATKLTGCYMRLEIVWGGQHYVAVFSRTELFLCSEFLSPSTIILRFISIDLNNFKFCVMNENRWSIRGQSCDGNKLFECRKLINTFITKEKNFHFLPQFFLRLFGKLLYRPVLFYRVIHFNGILCWCVSYNKAAIL